MYEIDIRDVRAELGLTQEKLAKRLGVSVTTISRWERGAHKPSSLAIWQLRKLQHAALEHDRTVRARARGRTN